MDIIYLLLPIALIIVLIIIGIFFWAVKSDQFEDMEGPAHRILMDDDDGNNKKPEEKLEPESKSNSNNDTK